MQMAPTARNWQPYRIVVIEDEETKKRLASCMAIKNADAASTAPGVAVFLSDEREYS